MVSGFADILKAAKERPLERVQVLIERAPECRSIFASGFPEKTSKDDVIKFFFHEWGEIEDVSFSDPWDENVKEKRVIVYFKHKKSKSFFNCSLLLEVLKVLSDALPFSLHFFVRVGSKFVIFFQRLNKIRFINWG